MVLMHFRADTGQCRPREQCPPSWRRCWPFCRNRELLVTGRPQRMLPFLRRSGRCRRRRYQSGSAGPPACRVHGHLSAGQHGVSTPKAAVRRFSAERYTAPVTMYSKTVTRSVIVRVDSRNRFRTMHSISRYTYHKIMP